MTESGPQGPLSRQIPWGRHPVAGKGPRAPSLPPSVSFPRPEDLAVPIRSLQYLAYENRIKVPRLQHLPTQLKSMQKHFKKNEDIKNSLVCCTEKVNGQYCREIAVILQGPGSHGDRALKAAGLHENRVPRPCASGAQFPNL